MPTDFVAPETTKQTALIVEALLFVADQPVTEAELAAALALKPPAVKAALDTLTTRYQQTGSYLRLQRHKDQVQLVTASAATPYIEQFLGLSQTSKLSTAALETLGIVAYKQPITRAEIEAIRGVGSGGVLRNLLGKGLIEAVGRLDTVGHPIQYGTTFEFLKHFGLESLAELPGLALDDPKIEDESVLTPPEPVKQMAISDLEEV